MQHFAAASEHHQQGPAASALHARQVSSTVRHRVPDRREHRRGELVHWCALSDGPASGWCASRQQRRQCIRQWDWQSLLRPRASSGSVQVTSCCPPSVIPSVVASVVAMCMSECTRLRVQGQVASYTHELPNGLHLEVLHQAASQASSDSSRAPLLFLHGAGHAAWCWQVPTNLAGSS